jgi:hypothetical protein
MLSVSYPWLLTLLNRRDSIIGVSVCHIRCSMYLFPPVISGAVCLCFRLSYQAQYVSVSVCHIRCSMSLFPSVISGAVCLCFRLSYQVQYVSENSSNAAHFVSTCSAYINVVMKKYVWSLQ